MRTLFLLLLPTLVTLAMGCDRGSVGHTAINRCVPEGQCDPAMLTKGLVAAEGDPTRGAELFRTHCATCHGPNGSGGAQTPGIDFTTAVWQSRYRDGQIASIIRGGRPPKMAAFPLADRDLRDLVAFVRSLKSATAPRKRKGY